MVSTNAQFNTSNGTINGTTALTLTSGTGAIALNPASNQSVSTNAKLVTSQGTIESSSANGMTLQTDSSDLTLAPAGNIVFNRPVITSDGHFSSTSGTDFIISAGSNAVVKIMGKLEVEGGIDQINTQEITVADKTILLGSGSDDDGTVSGAGIVLDGTAFGASAGAKDLSILWNAPASGANAQWQFQGGDLSFQRKTTSLGTVRYVFSIDDASGDLQFLKQVDADNTGTFTDAETIVDFASG